MVGRPILPAALLLAALLAPPPAAAQTVTDFLRDPARRDAQIGRCLDDEAEARRPRCANAERAASLAGRHRGRTRTPAETLADPDYYRRNRLAARITLAECETGVWRTVTAADCRAAAAASR